jgi:N-acetylglucosamine-6-phosphate deacetylase
MLLSGNLYGGDYMKAFKNIRLITTSGVLENKAVVFDEKIVDIIDETNISADMEIIDGMGNYLSPGLIDIHIHGCEGRDTMDEAEDTIYEISKSLVKTGVTSFLPTTMTMEFGKIENALGRIKRQMNTSGYAEVLGCHLEGPFINKKYKGAQDGTFIIQPDFNKIKPYSDVIKIVTIAPEIEGSHEFIKECRNNNIVVSIGHSNASFDEAKNAIETGASHITHTFNAMTPLHHRNPGIVGAAMYFDVTCEMIIDNVHVHPAVQRIMHAVKGNEKIILISDAMRACLLKDGEYDLGGQNVYVKNNEARLTDGTIAGSVLTMNKAVKNFIENTGIKINQAVGMASLNPARLLGVDNRKGSIERDKDSDFVLFDEDFNVIKTFVKGTQVF